MGMPSSSKGAAGGVGGGVVGLSGVVDGGDGGGVTVPCESSSDIGGGTFVCFEDGRKYFHDEKYNGLQKIEFHESVTLKW
jgi:hypothetical protein